MTIDSKKVENMLTGYIRTIPKAMDKGLKNLAGVYAKKYLEQLPRAKSMSPTNKRGIQPFTGESFTMLREQIKNPIKIGNGYAVVVPSHLIALDQMRPHGVQLKRGRTIGKWALRNLGIEGTIKVEQQSKMKVWPHPWIQDANRNARRFIKKHPRKEIEAALRRKGR